MATAVLATVVLIAILTLAGIHRRQRLGKPCDRAYVTRLVLNSAGLSAAVSGLIFPTLWLIISTMIRGGPIEQNLPPGFSADFLMAALVIGGAMTLVDTFFNYKEHVDPSDSGGS